MVSGDGGNIVSIVLGALSYDKFSSGCHSAYNPYGVMHSCALVPRLVELPGNQISTCDVLAILCNTTTGKLLYEWLQPFVFNKYSEVVSGQAILPPTTEPCICLWSCVSLL